MALAPAALKALAIELSAAMPPTMTAPDSVLLPLVDPSPRARWIRRISEIVNARGWQIEVTRTLDRHAVSYVSDLDNEALRGLLDRLERFEDCVQSGFDLHEWPDT